MNLVHHAINLELFLIKVDHLIGSVINLSSLDIFLYRFRESLRHKFLLHPSKVTGKFTILAVFGKDQISMVLLD